MSKKKKTLYIKNELTERIETFSNSNNISFNQAVTFILNHYFREKNTDKSK